MAAGPDDAARRAEFDRVALVHLDALHGTALWLCRDRARAADLVQETYLRAWRFFHRFEPGTNCHAWLTTILHNAFRNRYRAEQRTRGEVDIDEPSAAAEASLAGSKPSGDPQGELLAGELDDEVSRALAALPVDFRAAIVLVDLQELSYEEAARALACPVGTVRSRLSRGRRALARSLEGYAAERGIGGGRSER